MGRVTLFQHAIWRGDAAMLLSVMRMGQRVLRQLAQLVPCVLLSLGVTATPVSAQLWVAERIMFDEGPACVIQAHYPDDTKLAFLTDADLHELGVVWFIANNGNWPYRRDVETGDAYLVTEQGSMHPQSPVTVNHGIILWMSDNDFSLFIQDAWEKGFSLVLDDMPKRHYSATGLMLAWGAFAECVHVNFGGDSVMPRDPFVR